MFYLHACAQSKELGSTLYWSQSVDEVKGWSWLTDNEKRDLRNGLQRSWNINDTGHLHYNLPLYVGQRIRLTEKIDNSGDQDLNLMQEAEGTVVHIVPDPRDPCNNTKRGIKLKYCPVGVWVRMDKCKKAPLQTLLEQRNVIPDSFNNKEWTPTHDVDDDPGKPKKEEQFHKMSQKLVFIKASQRTFQREFLGKQWSVVRRQLPITSAQHRTVQSSQGYTLRKGILLGLGNLNTCPMNYWLNVYVMLSRGISLYNLLILRCPPKSFFDEGPPKYLRQFLRDIEGLRNETVTAAKKAAQTLGL